ncbi:reverse transcriptase domain-containing protein [Tanacetum coccineum]
MGTFTRLKCLLNDIENNGVTIPQAEVNATFINSLPRKWLSMNQTQRVNNSIKNDSLATLYAKYNYEEGLIDQIYESETQRFSIQASSSKAFISNTQFQDSNSDVEEDQRTSNEFMADLNAKYHERALLANQKRFYKRSGRVGSARKPIDKTKETCFACGKTGHFQKDYPSNKTSTPSYPSSNNSFNKYKSYTPPINQTSSHNIESVSSENEGTTRIRAFMAIAEDEPFMGKADARSGQWVDITMKKIKNMVNKYNLLKKELSLHKSELSNLRNIVSINCSLQNEVIKQIPSNIVKALRGKGRRKENNPSKEVLFTKAEVSTSEFAPMITSDSEDDSGIQEPLPPLPKLTGADPSGASKSLISLSDLTANMADLTLNTASKEIKKSSNKTQGTIFNQNDEVVLIAPRRRDVYIIDMSSFNKESNAYFLAKASPRMENLNEVRVKELRSDNRIEFRNHKLEEFYDEKAAKTMLNSAKLPKQFWRDAVNTACYTQNRSIIVKRHGKTAYDVFSGRSPDISYFYIFGCPVHIHNHRDHLGKFNEKADDGFFLGYSLVAKAFRVFNIRRQEIEETVHVTFSKDDEAISQTSTKVVLPILHNSITSEQPPEFTIADGLLAIHKPDHAESADILESAKPQDNVLCESISDDQPTLAISPSAKVILQNPVPQDRWSRKKHIELVNIIGEPLAEEIYVQQPPGFERSEFPNHVCKLDKALYGLKQAPRAWYQANPKESYLVVVKIIFRYLIGTPNLGLWYPKGLGFDLKAYSDSDYAGCNLDRKSTSGGCQILRGKLVPIFCDNTSAIAISNNPVLHSRTKHIDIRYHFIRDYILKGDIELRFLPTELQLVDIFTKPLAEPRFTRVVAELEHHDLLYHPMLNFLSNSSISIALTKEPSAMYVEYLKDFWYTTEVDDATKDILFSLSLFENQLLFTRFDFLTAIGHTDSKTVVPLPPKGTVRAGLATLGLSDKDKPSLTACMSTRSSARRLLSPIEDPERLLSRRNRSEPSLLFDLEEDDMAGQALPWCASGSSNQDAHITSLTKQVEALLSLHRPVNSVQNGCETCGGPHAYYECQAAGGYTQEDIYATTATSVSRMETSLQERPQGVLPSNTIPNPREDLKAITTWSGVTLARPSVPPPPLSSSKEVKREPETTTDQVLTESTIRVLPLAVQPSPTFTSSELPPAPVSSHVFPEQNPHQPPIPYPLRLNKEKLQDKSDIQIHSFLQMFKKLYFNISLAKALAYMPKFTKMVKDLLTNKEKLFELENTPLNENCSAVLLKKLHEKLGDTGRFLIPCDFYRLESCMALADLGASINLMPLFVWKTLSLPELTPTQMTLELATQTIAYPAGIAEDVFIQVGKFTFPTDFVVVDYDVDPQVPLILGRPFLRKTYALVDVHGEELTLRVGDEKLVFNVESTLKYPRKHGDESIHKIDILDIRCEDHFHEEIDTFLASDDSTSQDVDDEIFDLKGDICFIEELLNNDISNDLSPPLLVFVINETEKIKSSIDDPPDLELKDLPSHL